MAERVARAFLRFAGQVVASLATFTVLERLVVTLGRLPPAAYERAFFAPAIAARVAHLLRARAPGVVLVGAVALGAAAAAAALARPAGRRRALGLLAGWDAVDEGPALRWLVGAATGIATCALAGYPYNAYFDRAHAADRLLLVALWGALLWRPAFALPFALVASAVAQQFQVPLASYSWTEMELLVRIPILLAAFWCVRAMLHERTADAFVFLLCCLLAVTWWASGSGKLRVGWITHPHVDLLLLGAYANGWLGDLPADTVVRLADVVAAWRLPLMLLTLAVECGALLLLWRRWSLVAFPAITIAFHLGAFALTGILFWKWILLDVALLAFLLQGRRVARLRIFSPAHFALAVAVVLGHPAWVAARNLTWFDTPLTYAMRLEGVDAAGGVHVLPAGFFRPYAETFVLETFPYLSPHTQLTGPMGVTQSRDVAAALVAAREPSDVFALERTLATSRYDAERGASFDRFVARWLRTLNRRTARGARARPGTPRHLWTFPLDADWDGTPAIVAVRVVELTSFYDGRTLRVIRVRPLRTIDVARGVSTPAGP